MFSIHYLHETVITPNRTILILDVADTLDCGWEGAYSVIEEDEFAEAWQNCPDVDGDYTDDDIKEWAEDLCNECSAWEVVSNHHRTPETAEKKLRAYIKKNFN